MVKIIFNKLNSDATTPQYAHEGDAGMDLYSCESLILNAGERRTVKLGISSSFPQGSVALIWDRSGNAAKRGIKTMAGVIDAGYRGEWMIVLLNTSNEDFEINKGDKIAQALIQPIISAEIEEADALDESERGKNGFGSTGR